MSDAIIGSREFADGTTRPVYTDLRGEYVIYDGERVYGIWILPADEPIIAIDC